MDDLLEHAVGKRRASDKSAPASQAPFMEPPPELRRHPLVLNLRSFGWISNRAARITEGRAPVWWWALFVLSVLCLGMLVLMFAYQLSTGIGVWGDAHPVMWGWDIVNFVWWIGIGHAGTLISAILFLLRQRWRTAVNRVAEAMTIFAVICAGIYPALHVGRAWYNWWLFPIPDSNAIWPQFRSPLMWDVFAVLTYFIVSVMFWYLGLIPDLAVLRDRARSRSRQILYGLFALGWTGSNRHWSNYEKAYLLLAGLSTALVVSVHSIVSLDFSVSQLPGWHTTLLPPYFVAGAVFSGLGMLLTLVIPLRSICQLEDIITMRHIDNLCKVTLAMGLMIGYAYATEYFIAWYGGNANERFHFINRVLGPYFWAWMPMVAANVLAPQLFWFKKVRQNLVLVFIISILVNVGMWFERFVIIVIGLHRDFLPSNWGYYRPTWVDICTFIGTFGLFFTCFLLFVRFLPMIAISEVKGLTAQADPYHPLGGRQANPDGGDKVVSTR
jgi:Ni/Fe-hydrogenase subunit HybB-like protein